MANLLLSLSNILPASLLSFFLKGLAAVERDSCDGNVARSLVLSVLSAGRRTTEGGTASELGVGSCGVLRS